MPLKRMIVLASSSRIKEKEIARSLEKYDVMIKRVPYETVFANDGALQRVLHERGDAVDETTGQKYTYWVKGVFDEKMRLYQVPPGGLAEFQKQMERGEVDEQTEINYEDNDCMPVIAYSRLCVHQLEKDEQAKVREARSSQMAMAIHALDSATAGSGEPAEEQESALSKVETIVYENAAEGYLDLSRRVAGRDAVFGWDDVFVLGTTHKTYAEMMAECAVKVSPRDNNVNSYVCQWLHYAQRKATNFVRSDIEFPPFDKTISFDEERSVGAFIAAQEHMNNPVAKSCGLRNVFVAVCNHGAFFRAARTRREVNYWCPGMNAGIPFVAKKDIIHEITFMAHDFGHFLIPDLIYTGGTSALCRRVYILYRMMSEGTTLVFADMLFVESLRRAGYQYDWAKRRIHPLFAATGVNPFEAGDTQGFLSSFRRLLEANVAYCLRGDTSKFKAMIESAGGLDQIDQDGAKTCQALEDFQAKYMPFFVEDYKWTSANYTNMSDRAPDYKRWWCIVEGLVVDSGIDGLSSSGIGLETVEGFMAAIGVDASTSIGGVELIDRIFERSFTLLPVSALWNAPHVIEPAVDASTRDGLSLQQVWTTRIKPVLEPGEALTLDPPDQRRTQSFVRYLVGQSMLFARYSFVDEVQTYRDKILGAVRAALKKDGVVSLSLVRRVRALYRQCLRQLHSKALITSDDVENFSEIYPLFDPVADVFVSYDEDKSFYKELQEVQRAILGET